MSWEQNSLRFPVLLDYFKTIWVGRGAGEDTPKSQEYVIFYYVSRLVNNGKGGKKFYQLRSLCT